MESVHVEIVPMGIGQQHVVPVKVDWPELRLTDDQIAENALALAAGVDAPHRDRSMFTVEVTMRLARVEIVWPHDDGRFNPKCKPGRGLCSMSGCDGDAEFDRIETAGTKRRAFCSACMKKLKTSWGHDGYALQFLPLASPR